MTINLPDLWEGCYDGPHRQQSPEQFKQTFCTNCLNAGCRNSKAAGSAWMNRVLTQEERLLRNPLFAMESDPRFSAIRDIDFKDMLQQALALEVADRKNDWTIPTESEIISEASRMFLGGSPVGFQPPPEEPPKKDPEPIVDPVKDSWTVKGDGNTNYSVTRSESGAWSCTCNAFKFSKSNPAGCKHIELITVKLSRSVPPSEPTGPSVKLPRPPPINVPLATNTRMPDSGLMIGGASPPPPEPAHDPWAVAPSTTEKKIAVGGRVVLGTGISVKKEGE